MPKHVTWDDLVATDKNNAQTKSTSAHHTEKQITDSSYSVQDDIRELISQLSPDAGPHISNVIGVHIYQKLGSEGLSVFDGWYQNSTDYPGTKKAQEEYASYADTKHSVDKSYILKLIDDTDNAGSPHNDEQLDRSEKSDREVTEKDEPNDNANDPRRPIALDKYSLKGKSQELAAQASTLAYILYQIAYTGQSTVIFGAPNAGKTLITLVLLLDAMQDGRIKAEDIYYLDLDDSLQGLLEKLTIFEELGANIIADGHQDFNASLLIQLLNEISRKNEARGKVIILDTLKKFVDVMNKRQTAEWGKAIRRFIAKGGSVIALAHVNKNTKNGKPVFAGVSDTVDDCDVAFTLRTVNIDETTKIATVEFENIKRRGDVADSVGFMFSVDPSISYEERLASVQRVDEEELEKIKMADSLKADDELINVTSKCISEGINTKMQLRDEISRRTGISKRKAVQLIESYEGTDPSKHKWNFTMHEHGRKVYSLLTGDTDAE